ncbi:hypothetical protein Godav_014009 [Gossypium davidsonii]|uniref:Uncharacterized protein n=1 Tax=Gossypium davidsonii TaxID=34287 RepID=A0A7J8RJ64_GOSDV|nr:hypothetical protein [Gossypium davidsonii]
METKSRVWSHRPCSRLLRDQNCNT